jgi:mono/diheme cytochrome c family protein
VRAVFWLRRFTVVTTSAAFAWAVACGDAAGAAQLDGGLLYRKYCASCHGISGRGDGPDASIFRTPPRNLREGFLQRYPDEDLVRRVREGRPLELALDPPALRARASEVEVLVAYLTRLPSINWVRVERGREMYVERCEQCHGPDGRPGPTLPPGVRKPRDLSDAAVQRSIGDKELLLLVRHGRKGMPALTPRIPESAGPPLAAFVRLLSPGFALYDTYCANCHGDDGRGVNTTAEVIRLPQMVFDRAYFSRRDPEQLREAVWHMVAEQKPLMPHYRWTLDEAQARAIIEYLKHTQ